MDATGRWRELLARPEGEIPLDEACLLVSAHARPSLDIAGRLADLDRLAELAEAAAGREGRDGDTAAVLDLLFHRLGLRGDTATYGDPRNSYLDQVLERRLGIPISLSIVVMEVGRRVGLAIEGVGMPGHFLVRDRDDPVPGTLIDPFHAGRRVDPAGCAELFRSVFGPTVPFAPSSLAASGTRAILARVLANLDRSFRERKDHRSLGWVTELRAEIPGQPIRVQVEVARALHQLGRPDRAADVLERAAADGALSETAVVELTRLAAAARAQLN